MAAIFHVFISTFVDDRSVVFSSIAGADAREILQYAGDQYLKSEGPGKISQSFVFGDKWCSVVIFREHGETVVRGERRKFNEIRLAVSDQALYGTPLPAIERELIEKLEEIGAQEFSKLQPIVLQVDPGNLKRQELTKKMSETKSWLLGLMAILAVVGIGMSFLFSSFESFKSFLPNSHLPKKAWSLPQEAKDPKYYQEIVNLLRDMDIPIEELLEKVDRENRKKLEDLVEIKEPETKRFKFVIAYFFWQRVAASVGGFDLKARDKESIGFLCNSEKSAEKIFAGLETFLERENNWGLSRIKANAAEKIKVELTPKPSLSLKETLESLTKTSNMDVSPLVTFFPMPGKGDEKVGDNYPGNYWKGCKTWEDLYNVWGYDNGDDLKKHRDELVLRLLQKTAVELLKEEEKNE